MNLKKLLIATTLVQFISLSHADDSGLTFGPQKSTQGNVLDAVAVYVGDDIITVQEARQLGTRKGLERLIVQKLLEQEAQKYGITVSKSNIDKALAGSGTSSSREAVRSQLIVERLQILLSDNLVNISEQEVDTLVEQLLKQSDDKVQLVDILVRVPESADIENLQKTQQTVQRMLMDLQSKPAQSVAKQYGAVYNDLGWVELGKIPTAFSEVLVDAPKDKFLEPIIDKDGIHVLKILNRQSSVSLSSNITETKASHILISEKDTPDAKKTIQKLHNQLVAGESFTMLAEQYSQDAGSASRGGSLNWVYPSQMVPEFEQVMDATGEGQISAPFKTKFGYHIIKVEKRRQNTKSTRQALERKARQTIFKQRAQEEWEKWIINLRNESNVEILID